MYTDSTIQSERAGSIRDRVQGRSVAEVVAAAATQFSDHPFLVLGHRRWTYAEINAQAGALAAGLRGLGVQAGDRVALVLPSGPEWVLAYLAAAKLGCVVVPQDPRSTPTELQYTLRHSETSVYFSTAPLQGIRAALPDLRHVVTLAGGTGTQSFSELLEQGRDLEPVAGSGAAPDDVFAIVYASGIAGKPRGVVLSHAAILAGAAAAAEAVELREDDVVFGVNALFTAFGIGPGLLGTLLGGASLVLHDSNDPARVLDVLEGESVSIHHGVPTSFILELREPTLKERKLGRLRSGIVAGAPVSEDLLVRIQRSLVPEIRVGYGLTEAGPLVSVTRAGDPVWKQIGTVGRPVDGNRIQVLGPDGEVLPEESVGEIVVRGPGVMLGYHRQPGETAAAFTADGFFRTGDLGMLDDEGFLHVLGRRKEMIIRGGFNVYPREVEDRLHAHPAVLDAAVVGLPDEVLGEVACACIVPVEGAIITGPEILEFCRETLAPYKVPDLVRFLDALPTTGSGKRRRVELARMISAEESSRRP